LKPVPGTARSKPSNNNDNDLPAIPGKRYFTIGKVAELCAVKAHVLRYWEQEFPISPVNQILCHQAQLLVSSPHSREEQDRCPDEIAFQVTRETRNLTANPLLHGSAIQKSPAIYPHVPS
jgi:hypothetical protein